MAFEDFRKTIYQINKGEEKASVIILITDEPYFLLSARNMIKKLVVPEEIDFNYSSVYGRDSLSSLIETADMQSFFANHKYLVCTIDDKADNATEVELSKFNSENATLFILSGSENSRILSKVKNAKIINAHSLSEDELNYECGKILQKYGINDIEYQAKNLIIQKCGKSISLVNAEVSKLVAFKENTITIKIVDELVSDNMEFKIYELSQALAKKEFDKSFKILDELIRTGLKPMDLLGAIHKYFRQMLHALINKDMKNDELSIYMEISPGALFYLKKAASAYSQVQLKEIADYMFMLQYKVVSGRRDANMILDSAIARLIQM